MVHKGTQNIEFQLISLRSMTKAFRATMLIFEIRVVYPLEGGSEI
jgi:hypothetical protein